MPIYEYRCQKCNYKFEVLQRVGESNESLTCPFCDEPRPEKIFSVFGSGSSSGSSVSSGGCSSSGPFT